ncbi:MAG TPA: aminotransferase class I/II [Desulfobulbaceae bacterium]|jgi:aspartate/methionine/tyrosine aminotransferase|uniref:pyridoxal phosphate-dependent aminotransferase n=1 Tax=Desulfuromonas sp. CSMB_57 TaxID=2807629 RepID=UPI000E8CD75F|nr:aminotransferase class I/II-fold pyridoxal phosphate-dependent enzyme [Desulfuromonas sp. CSMB_57]HBI14052.1 aminotransferase class I/II [Desulfobulbaceae bacterium]
MFPALNPLVLSLRESATLAINRKALELRRKGQTIFHFGFGQSPFPVPESLQEALRRNVHQKDYLPTRGLPELCRAVASFYRREFNFDYSAEDVCIGPGSKELIFQTIYLVEGPLLVPAPSWVSYGPQAALRGKGIVPIATQRENGYRLQADELDRACHSLGQCQKLLILNNPNNPTGGFYKQSEMEELAEICRAYQVLVISDEIYAMLNFTDRSHASMAHYYPEGTIVSGGLSKSFAAGGYRLGVLLVPKPLRLVLEALQSVISETFSAVSAPIQYAALEAYGNFEAVRPFVRRTCDIHRYVCEYVYQRLLTMGLNCPRPEGAFYLFPDFQNQRDRLRKKGILTGQRLCDELLQQVHVAVLPGVDFYLAATALGVRVAPVDYDGAAALQSWPGSAAMTDELAGQLFPRIIAGCHRLEDYLLTL